MRRTSLAALFAGLAVVACDSGSDPVLPGSIDISDEVDVLLVGQTWALDIEVLDEDGNLMTDADLEFESDNTAVATVNDQGVVTGVGEGLANITASAGAASDFVPLAFIELEDPCTNAVAIGFDQPVRTSLQTGDCQLDDESFVDFWFFDLEEAATVTIQMNSADVGTTLWLFNDTDPDPIAEDPGAATASSAEIEKALEPGTYIVAAAAWPDQTGVYTLTADGTVSAGTAAVRLEGEREVTSIRRLPVLRR